MKGSWTIAILVYSYLLKKFRNNMDCIEYKKLYKEFTDYPLSKSIMDSDKFYDWNQHFFSCEKYPCIHLAYYSQNTCMVCENCPDQIIRKSRYGFGINVHDGVNSDVEIKYCPWCGIKI